MFKKLSNKIFKNDWHPATFFSLALFSILISLLFHWEAGSEIALYWSFARIFTETGQLIFADRAPLYVIYLSLFSWLGYPLAVIAEYIVTSLIAIGGVFIFFSRHLGKKLALFTGLLWLPFFHIGEPPVQMLALAFSLFALSIRLDKGSNKNGLFYFLLGISYLLRPTYQILIFSFLIWDLYNFFKGKSIKIPPKSLIKYWPVLIIFILSIYFSAVTSPHPWNNAYATTTEWFPTDGIPMVEAAFIQNYNGNFIADKIQNYDPTSDTRYISCQEDDFYFTNQELFNGASTIPAAVRANPNFVIKQFFSNYVALPYHIASLTILSLAINSPTFESFFVHNFSLQLLGLAIGLILSLLIFSWLFRMRKKFDFTLFKNADTLIFLFGTVLMTLASLAFLHSKLRYLINLIPLLIFLGIFFGNNASNLLKARAKKISGKSSRLILLLATVALPLFLIIFSNGVHTWGGVANNIANDFQEDSFPILENSDYSMKASFNELNSHISDCQGVMALEHNFIAAFMDIPHDNVYDIWEIPPFGSLANSTYTGLNGDRVNCLFISDQLATNSACGASNSKIRYDNYIKPYAEGLVNDGADVYEVPHYGVLYILNQEVPMGLNS